MTVLLLRSPKLGEIPGVHHGFTTRCGGFSTGSYASLNLGGRTADDVAKVASNRRRVLSALGHSDGTFVSLSQVHGAKLVEVNRISGNEIEADGLWTQDPRAVIAVMVADCVPILISDGAVVAAVHAGWRGTRAHITSLMIRRLRKIGLDPLALRVAIGPAIGPCCFEVGEQVAAELSDAYPQAIAAFAVGTRRRSLIDLWSLNQSDLLSAGLDAEQIDCLRFCTHCDPRFFSHRRDGAQTGRQAGVIALSPPPEP